MSQKDKAQDHEPERGFGGLTVQLAGAVGVISGGHWADVCSTRVTFTFIANAITAIGTTT